MPTKRRRTPSGSPWGPRKIRTPSTVRVMRPVSQDDETRWVNRGLATDLDARSRHDLRLGLAGLVTAGNELGRGVAHQWRHVRPADRGRRAPSEDSSRHDRHHNQLRQARYASPSQRTVTAAYRIRRRLWVASGSVTATTPPWTCPRDLPPVVVVPPKARAGASLTRSNRTTASRS